MAQISSITINSDGRSFTAVVTSLSTGGTYKYDAVNSQLNDISTAKMIFSVVSKGFDATGAATTINRTVYGTCTQRQAGSSSLNESGSNPVTIVGALSDPIYAKDKSGVGNSGTDVTVSVLSGWYTQGGTSTEAITNLTVTNNSSLAYYVPFGQWDILPALRVDSNFRVAFTARHLHGIACVKFTATGATSAHSQTSTVTSESKRQTIASGMVAGKYLHVLAHETTITISGYTQDEQINLKAEIFPLVGDTEMDTDDNSSDVEATGRGPRHCICDKNNTIRTYGFVTVAASGGTASTTLATAQASPFPTIKAAIDAGATQIYLNGNSTTHNFDSRSTNKTNDWWVVIEPASGVTGSAVLINGSFPTPRVKRLMFYNVEMKLSSSASCLYGADRTEYLCIHSCTHNANSNTLTEYHVDFEGLYHYNTTFDDGSKWKLLQFSTDKFRFIWDGCYVPTTGRFSAFWRIVGSRISGASDIRDIVSASDTKPSNILIEFNEIDKYTADANTITLFNTATQQGNSVLGNIIEGITADVTPGQLLSITEGSAFDLDHIIFSHNTIIGERSNIGYNDSGSTAYYRRGWRIIGNIFNPSFNTKHDVFGTPNSGRIGGWWIDYSTTKRYNMQVDPVISTFPGTYAGVGSVVSMIPDFANSLIGSVGGGNYSLRSSSHAIEALPSGEIFTSYDIYGTPYRNNNTDAVGAINTVADAISLPPQGGHTYIYPFIYELLNDDTDFGIYGAISTTAVLQSGMLLWHTYSSTLDSNQYVWNLYSSTLDTNQYIWNTYSSLLDTNQYIWNVYSSTIDTNQYVWNVASSVIDTNQYIWHAASGTADSTQFVWNTYSATIDSNNYLWNTYSSIADTMTNLWNVYSSVNDSNQYVWNTYSGTASSDIYLWDVIAQVQDDLNLQWNVYSSVIDTSIYKWDTYSGVTSSHSQLWNIRAFVDQTLDLLWDVEASLVSFQVYNIALYVTRNKTLAMYVTREVLRELRVRRGYNI